MKKKMILLLVLVLGGTSALLALEGEPYSFRYNGGTEAESVCLAGDFNDWSGQANPMLRDQDGCWKTVVFLTYGRHEYRFVVDGETWERDPLNPKFGGAYSNSVIYLPRPEAPTLDGFAPIPGQRLLENTVVIRADYEPGIYYDALDTVFSTIMLDGESVPFQFDSTQNKLNAIVTVADGEHQVSFFIQDTCGRKAAGDSVFFMVNANDSLPVAHAGFTQIGAVGEQITLSGGLSYDPDKDPIEVYAWKLLESPQHSALVFNNKNSANPVFTPSLSGRYLFCLKIQALGKWSAVDTVDVIALPLYKSSTR
ncbi:isoamylase early set domain-containing protein, partial [bacterium]|nr:isoamylase early set domain-containing protein [bacterium]